MTARIYKYQLALHGVNVLPLPTGARPLAVDDQDGVLCMWALIDDECSDEERNFAFVGTGHPIPGSLESTYIGTVQQPPFVWHLFEIEARS